MAKDIVTIPVQIGAALPDIAVKQGDAGSRILRLRFCGRDDGPIDLTGHLITLYAKKPDKTTEFTTAALLDADEGTAEITLSASLLSAAGVCECELTLTGPDETVLSTNPLRIAVLPLLREDAEIESLDAFPALLDALARAQRYNAQIFTMSVNGGEPHGPDENGNVDLLISGGQELTGYLRAEDLNSPGNPPALGEDGMLEPSVLPLNGYLKQADLGTTGNPPALQENGMLSSEVLPLEGYIPYASLGTPGNPPALNQSGQLSEGVLPLKGVVKASDLGKPGGPPVLGDDGKLSGDVLPQNDYLSRSQLNTAGNPPKLEADGKLPDACLPFDRLVTYGSLDTPGSAPLLRGDGTLSPAVVPPLSDYITEEELQEKLEAGELSQVVSQELQSLSAEEEYLTEKTVQAASIARIQGATLRDTAANRLSHAQPTLSVGETAIPLPALGEWDWADGETVYRGTSQILDLAQMTGTWSVLSGYSDAENGVCLELSAPLSDTWLPAGLSWGEEAVNEQLLRILCSHFDAYATRYVIYPSGVRKNGICIEKTRKIRVRVPLSFVGVTTVSEVTDSLFKAALEENKVQIAYGFSQTEAEPLESAVLPIIPGAQNRLLLSGLPGQVTASGFSFQVVLTQQRSLQQTVARAEEHAVQRFSNALTGQAVGTTVTIDDVQEGTKLSTLTLQGACVQASVPGTISSVGDGGSFSLTADETELEIPLALYGIPDGEGGFTVRDELAVDFSQSRVCLKQNVGQMVLTGEEAFLADLASAKEVSNYVYLNVTGLAESGRLLCNLLPWRPNGYAENQSYCWTSTVIAITLLNRETGIVAGEARSSYLEKFRAWMRTKAQAGTPLTIYYPLAAPQTEEVGEETKGRLLSIAPQGTGICLSTAPSPHPALTVSYHKDADKTIADLLSRIEALEEQAVDASLGG